MKRILMLTACVAMAVALTGCGDSKSSKNEEAKSSTAKNVAGESAKAGRQKYEDKASRYERIMRENISIVKEKGRGPIREQLLSVDIKQAVEEFKRSSSSKQDELLRNVEQLNKLWKE